MEITSSTTLIALVICTMIFIIRRKSKNGMGRYEVIYTLLNGEGEEKRCKNDQKCGKAHLVS